MCEAEIATSVHESEMSRGGARDWPSPASFARRRLVRPITPWRTIDSAKFCRR